MPWERFSPPWTPALWWGRRRDRTTRSSAAETVTLGGIYSASRRRQHWDTSLGPPLGAAVPAGGFRDWVFIRGHTVVIGLVVVLALAVMATVYSLKDELHVVWGKVAKKRKKYLDIETWNPQEYRQTANDKSWKASPLGLSQELPHCRRLASFRISITKVANSLALNLANFWRPWTTHFKRHGKN